MKRYILFFSILTLAILALLQAQASQVLNYQGVLKNPNGTVRPDTEAVLRLEFLQNNEVIYSEEHRVCTNSNGYFSLHPGAGNAVVGSFETIDWGEGTIVMRTILDGIAIAETQLTAVPYAMYAEQVEGWDLVWNSIDSLGYEHAQTTLLLDDVVLRVEELFQADDSLGVCIDSLRMHVDTQVANLKEQDAKTLKGANFYNATLHAPLEPGSYHTLQSALESTPAHLRHAGTVVTFRSDSINWRSVQYVALDTTSWRDEHAWRNYGGYGNLTIPYIENDSLTRLSIPDYMRHQGLIITYVKNNRVVNEQYLEQALDNTLWCKTESWLPLSAMNEEILYMRSVVDSINEKVSKIDKGLQTLANAGTWFYEDFNTKFSQVGGVDNQGAEVVNYDMVHTDFIPIQSDWMIKTYGNKTYPGISFYRDKNLETRIPSLLDKLTDDTWQRQEFNFMTDIVPIGAQYFTVNMVLEKKDETALRLRRNIENVIDTSTPYTYRQEESAIVYSGAFVNTTGKRTLNSSYRHSRFMPLGGTQYKISAIGNYTQDLTVPLVVYYSDNTFNSMVGYDLGTVQDDRSTRGEIVISPETAPEGATYFIVNSTPAQGESIIMSGSATPDMLNEVYARVEGLEGTKSCVSGRKLVTLGDSFTTNSGNKNTFWQEYLVEWSGLEWSREETLTGVNGFDPMGYGGAWVMPNDMNALSLRCLDVRRYTPQIIIIYGGQNDKTNEYKLGSIEDAPFKPEQLIDLTAHSEINSIESALAYIDGRFDKKNSTVLNIVANGYPRLYYMADTLQWDDPQAWVAPINTVSFYSAYKGIIERFLSETPYASIYCMTLMQCDSSRYDGSLGTWEEVDSLRRAKNEAIKEIADYYGVQVIDLWNKSGVTPYNAKSHYHDWLHPNQYGYRRLAECVYRHIK